MPTPIKTLHLDTVIDNHTQDMTGKVVLITGTTSGTGYVCAREMARLGAPPAGDYFGKNGGNLRGNGTDEENESFSGPRWERYQQTKLANRAFTYGLKQKLEQHGIGNVKVLLAHPGLAATNLQVSTAKTGGMDANSPFMSDAQ